MNDTGTQDIFGNNETLALALKTLTSSLSLSGSIDPTRHYTFGRACAEMDLGRDPIREIRRELITRGQLITNGARESVSGEHFTAAMISRGKTDKDGGLSDND